MAMMLIDALHRSEGPKLHRFLSRILGNRVDAADAAQETYLRLAKAVARTEIEHPRIFLFYVARNVAATLVKRRRLETALFCSLSDPGLGDIVDLQARTEHQVIARQQLRIVAAAIDTLPPRCREVFLLSAVDGLANGAIAVRLGITRNMVEKHLMKALLRIRHLCSDFFPQ